MTQGQHPNWDRPDLHTQQTQPIYVPAPSPKKKRWLVPVLVAGGILASLCCGGIAVMSFVTDPPKKPEVTLTSPSPKPSPTQVQRAVPSPTQAPPTKVSTFDLPVGSSVKIEDTGGVVEVTIKSVKAVKKCGDGLAPENGNYVVALVTAEVISGTASINPLNFEFVSTDGATNNTFSGMFADCGNELGSGNDLRTGSKRSGIIVFDTKLTKGEIVYNHFLGGEEASWKI